MPEYVVTLMEPVKETFRVEAVAFNVKERWEARGAGYRAEITLNGVEVSPEYA